MDSPKTLTDLVNLSLMMLGEVPVSSIESTTATAVACRRVLPHVLRREQSAFRWPELIAIWEPTEPLEEMSDDDWYQFTIPPLCLRILELLDGWKYRVESGLLITSTNAPKVRYLLYNETPDEWSPALADCIKYALAIEVAPTITNGNKTKLQLRQEYEQLALPQARRVVSLASGGIDYRPRLHRWNRSRSWRD